MNQNHSPKDILGFDLQIGDIVVYSSVSHESVVLAKISKITPKPTYAYDSFSIQLIWCDSTTYHPERHYNRKHFMDTFTYPLDHHMFGGKTVPKIYFQSKSSISRGLHTNIFKVHDVDKIKDTIEYKVIML